MKARGFTLIELLTVIAIIAILAALLFPLAGTVREQARASDCLSKLHQLWVSALVYHEDEGAYPAALMGYAEEECQPDATHTDFWRKPYNPNDPACVLVPANRMIQGFLYKEQVNDSRVFSCPDDLPPSSTNVSIAYFPPRPPNWPVHTDAAMTPYSYVTDPGTPVFNTCPTLNGEPINCFTSGPYMGQPIYYYTFDSYDVSPRILGDGSVAKDPGGNRMFELHYSTDWTGVTGSSDLPVQLKYANPARDKTILTWCTWHTTINGAPAFTAISLAGQAKKIDILKMLNNGANVLNL